MNQMKKEELKVLLMQQFTNLSFIKVETWQMNFRICYEWSFILISSLYIKIKSFPEIMQNWPGIQLEEAPSQLEMWKKNFGREV
jgi:hypothetical protein